MLNLMTEEQVSKLLHVSVASLRRWRLERRGPAFIKVRSLVRYKPEDLELWLRGSANRRDGTAGSKRESGRQWIG